MLVFIGEYVFSWRKLRSDYDEVVDFWDYSGCSDIDEEDDGLLHDPDFADSGTAWLSDEPKERAIQIAAQRALRRAEEEQVLYFSLTSSSGAKKRAKEAFFRKWKKYKALESILNAGNFDINLEGLDICGDKDEGLSSEGQKSVVDFDKPITAVEERHHSDSTVEGAANHFFKKSLASETVCPPLSKSSLRKARRYGPKSAEEAG